jgi:hypothetical protein
LYQELTFPPEIFNYDTPAIMICLLCNPYLQRKAFDRRCIAGGVDGEADTMGLCSLTNSTPFTTGYNSIFTDISPGLSTNNSNNITPYTIIKLQTIRYIVFRE